MHKIAFLGHRQLFGKPITERLTQAVETEIQNGCLNFIMGTHGEFDELALSVCRSLRNRYKEIEIEVVIPNPSILERDRTFAAIPYSDVKTIMYEIEDARFARQVTLSNRQMIDRCDTLICYVDTSLYTNDSKATFRYAEKRGLRIINLFRIEDEPPCGMTSKEIKLDIKTLLEKLRDEK